MQLKSILGWVVLAAVLLVAAALAVTAIRNRSLPSRSASPEDLDPSALAQLAEARHLLDELGGAVWPAAGERPGWGDVPIPLITYNEENAFIAAPDGSAEEAPPAGWVRVPDLQQLGNPWEPAAQNLSGVSERVAGEIYRAPLPEGDVTPQGFTVKVGDLWAASLATAEYTHVLVYNQFRQDLPPFLKDVFPYRLAARLLLQGPDTYEALVAHEAFHAYQGSVAPQRLIEGEQVRGAQEGRYPWDDESFEAAWKTELELLTEALRAETQVEARDLAHRFLTERSARRAGSGLGSALVDYERQREWVEGLAKYSELRIWEEAYTSANADPPTYRPVRAASEIAGFRDYRGYPSRYRNEVAQIKRTAGREGDGRFYYSGMAQAYLLDRLAPGWKAQVFDDGVFLEDLLTAAVDSTAPASAAASPSARP